MFPFEPPPWDGERVTLYHGTVESAVGSVLAGVDLRFAQPGKDFGRGFYTTTLLRQAIAWSLNSLNITRVAVTPAVVAFDVSLDDLARLDTLTFVRGEYEADRFWSFVWHCRQNDLHHDRPSNAGWYDVVAGPVAAAWRQRAPMSGYEQLSFHTPRAVALLNASRSWRER